MSKKFMQDSIVQAPSENREKSYTYDAFISYRHIEPDQSIAKQLHRMVESFKVPEKFNNNGKITRLRTFLAEEELSAGDLSPDVKEALKSSKYLIVICSRRLKFSERCLTEIRFFLSLCQDAGERIIPVLIEGEGDCDRFFPEDLKRTFNHNLTADIRPFEVLQDDFMGYERLQDRDRLELERLGEKTVRLLKKRGNKDKLISTLLDCHDEELEKWYRIEGRKKWVYAFVLIVLYMIYYMYRHV